MKNILVVILLSAFFTFNFNEVQAQKKCKFDYEKKDEFTGKLKKGNTTPIYPANPLSNEYWYLGINRTGDEYDLAVLLRLNGELNTYLEKGDSIMFKLENGNIITCYADERSSPETKAAVVGNQPVITSIYRSKYSITKEEMEQLSKSVVTFVRMNLAEKTYERALKEKYGKKLINNALCIMK